MKSILFVCLLFFALCGIGTSQTQPAARARDLNGERLFGEWLNRLNALDDWFISMDGKEQPEEVVNRLVELYAPEAMQFVGPNENQLGVVTLSGLEAIRKWADEMARTRRAVAWRVASRTFEENTASLFITPFPGGGVSVAAEVTLAFTDRFSERRFQTPGMTLVDFGKDGRIRRARFYVVQDETEEIFPYEILN